MEKEIEDRVAQLEAKFSVMGQDMKSYLDGLLHADYLTYWDYIHLDTLLSLQTPKTRFPDERIFVIYHQITELYFRLTLDALEQLQTKESPNIDYFKRQVRRVNSYFEQLINSFDIMVDGMDKGEFLQFRMSLLPASGFQSVQYRRIELMCSDMNNLVQHSQREALLGERNTEVLYNALYWKYGATELATGKRTLTLRQFEEKYAKSLKELGSDMQVKNIRQCYLRLSPFDQQNAELIDLLKELDLNANVRWNLAHYRSAARHLESKPKNIMATGGTNWQEYLPPRFQRIVFFPELWSEEENAAWGLSQTKPSKAV
jgi:tryptophan 2,3-dioxygenase